MLEKLLEKNRLWAKGVKEKQPDFFLNLAAQQAPEYLWIGCSDSRVPANQIVDLMPGEIFVHRNIANVMVHTDLNCLSVIQYAVDVLKVKHIIVCGHYGCGGVKAALTRSRLGLIENWLAHIKDVYDIHRTELDRLNDETQTVNRLCELNVVEQVKNVAETTILQDAWERGQKVRIHGWVYGIHDGIVNDLNISVNSTQEMKDKYPTSVAKVFAR
ncbi:MAG: carbonate dehydratase [Hahellaceae bacterium]|nr:carbonate dehydratase [Hahellaceae bacterium]